MKIPTETSLMRSPAEVIADAERAVDGKIRRAQRTMEVNGKAMATLAHWKKQGLKTREMTK